MKRIARSNLLLGAVAPLTLALASANAAIMTWDGGGSDGKTSTATNWSTDVAPAATGDTLVFAGATNLAVNNDSITSLATSGTAITFNAAAGSFNLGGNQITVGSGAGAGQLIIQQNSTNAQTISANLKLSGGNGDRSIVFGSGAGSLTLSGNIDFNGDWLYPNTTAGTLILSGSNVGDGKTTNALTSGSNIFRAMMRNNVAGTNLTLGSDGALGNSGSGDISLGTASLRGIVANQNMTLNTVGDRDLSGSSLIVNAGNITYNGSSNLKLAYIVTQAGNRDFVVSGGGTVTLGGGIALSNDQTGRRLYDNLSGTGGMVVNGKIYDTFHSGGITANTTTSDAGAVSTKSLFRKAGAGTLTLNGDSSGTFNGVMQVEVGTVKLGHGGALGASDGTSATATQLMGGTLDVNGQTIGEYLRVLSNSTISNSSAAAATITANADVNANLVVNLAGDLTATRLIGLGAPRTITKLGAGTLTTNGTSHNNLSNWDIQVGKVVLANTSGLGADRGVALNGGTLQLSGLNSDLINNNQLFTINSGAFDLNGKGEAIQALVGAGGIVTNTSAAAATVYVGGGVTGSGSGSYGGVIQNGVGTLALTKEGTGTQTLTGTNTYGGATTVSAGTLALSGSGSIANSLFIDVKSGATLDVSGLSTQFTVAGSQTLKGNGIVIGPVGVIGTLAPGASVGTLAFSGNVSFQNGSAYQVEIDTSALTGDVAAITGDINLGASVLLSVSDVAGTPALLNNGDKITIATYTGAWNGGTFGGYADDSQLVVGANTFVLNYNDSVAGTPAVTLTAIVPEPTSLAAIGMAATMLRRRKPM